MKDIKAALMLISMAAVVVVKSRFVEDRDLDGCAVQMSGNFFNLGALTKRPSDDGTEGDYQVSYTRPAPNKGPNVNETVTLSFNICEETLNDCSNENGNEDDFANIVYASPKGGQLECRHMSSPEISEVTVDLLDDEEPSKGVVLTYDGGDRCNETTDYSLELQMVCDELAIEPIYEILNPHLSSLSEECEPKTIVFRTAEACPKFSLGTLWLFFNDFYIFFGVLMIALGFYLMVFGEKYQDVTLFLTGQATVATLAMILIFAEVYPDRQDVSVVWAVLIVSLFIGAGAGYATVRYAKVGVIIFGAWLGGLIGSVLYSLLFRLITDEYPLLILWLCILTGASLVGYLSHVYFHIAVIVGSSSIGSYLFFRVSNNNNHSINNFRARLSLRESTRTNSCCTTACRTPRERSPSSCTYTWV